MVRCRQAAREAVAYLVNKMNCAWECNVPGAAVFEEKPKRSLLTRFVNLVSAPFRRLRAAGTAQSDILRGRLG
ncbi:hypothetical protein D3C85_1412000 [compost metagenome]